MIQHNIMMSKACFLFTNLLCMRAMRACDVLSMYACGLKFELFMYVGMLVITCD